MSVYCELFPRWKVSRMDFVIIFSILALGVRVQGQMLGKPEIRFISLADY